MSKFLRFALVATLMFAMGALQAYAQSTVTGAIGGVVTNPNNEVVPNATVTVRNVETNKEDTAQSDGEGRFRVVNLQPGNYTVTINSQGFSPFQAERIVVEVGRVTSIEAKLSITGVTGTVEVTSDAPVINTTQQDFSSNVNQVSINNLPINGQRWSNYALLTPATVPDGNFGLISFRGISGLLNNNTIDGGDNNQAFFSEERGRTRLSYTVSQFAIREFQVNTSNYSAEYGRSAGGVVNAVTKSGTNEFHGQVFYFQRNNKWGARNPLGFINLFDATTGAITITPFKPVDVRHQIGGNVGGPIVKNKAFFFFAYDRLHRNFPGLGVFSSASYLTTVNRTTLKGRGLNDTQINQGLSFLTSLTGPVPRTGDQKILMPKVDWHINNNNTFTATYNRLRWASPAGIQTQPTNTRGRASFGDDFVNIDSINLRLASTLSATIVNEFRYQWGRDNEFEFSQPPLPGEPTTSLNGRSPDVFLTNGIEFGAPTFLERTAFPDERRHQFADTVTMSIGSHTIKFGGDFNHVNDLQINLRNMFGAYSYSNINDFIVDYVNFATAGGTPAIACPTQPTQPAGSGAPALVKFAGRCYTSAYNQGFGPLRFQFNTEDYNLFVQDDWRFNPRLTLNLGVRYEYEALPKPFLGNPFALNPQRPGLLTSQTLSLPNDRNNFGPRLGFAWDITGDGRNSLRGGYGIYFGRIINSTILNSLTNTGAPGGQFQSSVNPTITQAVVVGGKPFNINVVNPISPNFPNILTSAPAGATAIQFFRPGFQNPLIQQGDLVFEHEVAKNTVVSASLLLSRGSHLPTFIDQNLNRPTTTFTYSITDGPFAGQTLTVPFYTGNRPNTNFAAMTEIDDIISSKYIAFVLQAERRLTNGLQFSASYTRSKSTDTGQGSATFTDTNDVYDPFNPGLDNGRSSFDIPNKFVASAIWNPTPFGTGSSNAARMILNGWTIAPIFSYYSGVPLNPTVSGSIPGGTAGGVNGSCSSGCFTGGNRFALVPRNAYRLPRIVNTDLRVSRRFHLRETMNLEVLGEMFNIFNRTQVTGENAGIYRVSGSTLLFQTNFQQINAAGGSLFRERQVQLAVRFEF
ncbi:MAG: hypothetical protein AUG51_06650 [Acidobacteria bacterium 13_1_20CM_3_53_8]|nr:MAG: hypothetical protein AUG51_06650 [Acidobacteria bacterium 13_1_20CM_3_53_8]